MSLSCILQCTHRWFNTFFFISLSSYAAQQQHNTYTQARDGRSWRVMASTKNKYVKSRKRECDSINEIIHSLNEQAFQESVCGYATTNRSRDEKLVTFYWRLLEFNARTHTRHEYIENIRFYLFWGSTVESSYRWKWENKMDYEHQQQIHWHKSTIIVARH